MQRFTELKVWQKAHHLVLEIYRVSKTFPTEERYGLTSQLRRAAVSVPTNIVEGSKRATGAEFARFLNIAEGSLVETEYLVMLARDLGYHEAPPAEALLSDIAELARMLHGLRTKVSPSP